MEDGHPAYRGAMENGSDHWSAAALRGEWRSVLGRADSAVGNRCAAGSYGNAVDGDCGLVEAGRAPAIRAHFVRNCDGLRGNGDPDWAVKTGIVRPSGSDRRRSFDRGVAGVGLRITLFEAWDAAQFANAGSGDAGVVRRRGAVYYSRLERRSCALSSSGSADARVDGNRLPDGLWFVHRIHGVSLYFEEQHGGAGGNVRVCESDCGADRGMGVRWGGDVGQDDAGRGSDFNGGGAGDYGAASRAARGGGCYAGSR